MFRRDDMDEDDDIYEISFCSECCDFYEAAGTSCMCVNLLLPRVCKFLMKKGSKSKSSGSGVRTIIYGTLCIIYTRIVRNHSVEHSDQCI